MITEHRIVTKWGFRQMDVAITKYIPFKFLSDDARIRLRVDVINLFNYRNYTNYFGNPNDPRYLEINGIGTGNNPARTIKLSAGFESLKSVELFVAALPRPRRFFWSSWNDRPGLRLLSLL